MLSSSFSRIAIVPARGGSKRIPFKNKKKFNGRPIIEWPLEMLIKSELFESVIVSTDDLEIAQLSRDLGAEVPFIRPKNLADDYSSTADVVVHALDNIPKHRDNTIESLLVTVVYPTGVFTTKSDLLGAMEMLRNPGVEHVFSAGRHTSPIERSWTVREDGCAEMINPGHKNTRTQELRESFFDAGQFYCSTESAWRKLVGSEMPLTALYVLPKDRAWDIDCDADWIFAEMMHAIHAVK
jgi:pseudaminic acid cytidylyltransferase